MAEAHWSVIAASLLVACAGGTPQAAAAVEPVVPLHPVAPSPDAAATPAGPPAGFATLPGRAGCTFRGKPLWGRVQVVDAFPDFKVKVVSAFPTLKVQAVTAFPDSCGKWQFVTAFPDFKIQFVDAFPDIQIQMVTAFPGM